ncbi:MAG: efflux RND transporter permease subunit [Colwellia sp.]|nr:efflux RND transporter permease subunit [Colwellia sp.]
MFSHFFIKRPIFASVISIVIVLIGAVSLISLPIDQYPNIAPPQVKVSASFSGATANVASESVGVPLEQELNGTPNMLYMESKSTNSGSTNITVTFEVGTDVNLAAVDVQNTASQAGGDLPVDVQQNGVTVSAESSVELLKIALTSSNDKYNDIYLSNYASINIQAALKRIPGVGRVRNTGARSYSMRIWIRPDRMAGYGLTVTDVRNAIKEQNKEAAAGTIGAQPMDESIKLNFPINAQGRYNKVEDFKNIMVKVDPDGSIIRLRDIASIELGSSAYTLQSSLNGQPATILQVYMLPGSNALDVTKRVKAEMAILAKAFPKGMNWVSFYDASEFIKLSIDEVKTTLFQALLLVILVVYLFLQNWRTTLIPALAVPVSIIGTFAALAAFGLTINTISLLALVLAIGIVVDDAIVVVESVERIIQEQKISVVEATKQAMSELSGALVATSLVLAAVFVPVSFLAGITGIMYREFAIAITVAVLISTLVALTLSPALCVLFLRENQQVKTNRFFTWFNQSIDKLANKYTGLVKLTCLHAKRSYLAFAVACIGCWFVFSSLPTGFIPQEDQGRFFVDITLPNAATVTRTNKVIKQAEKHILAHDAVAYSFSLAGENRRAGSDQAHGQLEVILKPWSFRADKNYSVEQVLAELKITLESIPTAQFNVYQPSAVSGVGSGSGVELALQDRSGTNFDGLMETLNLVLDELNKQPEIAKASSPVQAQVPLLFLDVDREKAMALQVPIADIYSTMQVLTGSSVVNDFNLFGRVYRVKMQAEEKFRARPSDLNNFYVRSANGAMVPMNVLAKINLTTGPSAINRYNLFSSANINVDPAEGYSSGDAIAAIERVTEALLPPGMGYEWTGLTYQEIKSSGQMNTALILALIFVFLFLSALYESWTLPLAVLLISPIAMLGASLTVWLVGIENNLFFQVAFISLIGLAAKNSILIVEVANQFYRSGLSAQEAAFKAASVRFRPIMMTAASFILGVLPLVLATGPGSVSRQSISYPILGGMILASTIGIILVPLFFITVARFVKVKVEGDNNE